MRAQHRPEWLANLGRLILDVLRGAPKLMTTRAIAVGIMQLAGHDVSNRQAVEIIAIRVRASLTHRARATQGRGSMPRRVYRYAVALAWALLSRGDRRQPWAIGHPGITKL
jgi:hypothetical protein